MTTKRTTTGAIEPEATASITDTERPGSPASPLRLEDPTIRARQEHHAAMLDAGHGADLPDHHRDGGGRDPIGALLEEDPVRVEERRAIT